MFNLRFHTVHVVCTCTYTPVHIHIARDIDSGLFYLKKNKRKSNNNSCVSLSRHYGKITSVSNVAICFFPTRHFSKIHQQQNVQHHHHNCYIQSSGPFRPTLVPCLSLIWSSLTILLSFHHNQMYRVKHQDHIF